MDVRENMGLVAEIRTPATHAWQCGGRLSALEERDLFSYCEAIDKCRQLLSPVPARLMMAN